MQLQFLNLLAVISVFLHGVGLTEKKLQSGGFLPVIDCQSHISGKKGMWRQA
jgi:hypothetical protein